MGLFSGSLFLEGIIIGGGFALQNGLGSKIKTDLSTEITA